MSYNKVKIRRGSGVPDTSDISSYELGYDYTNNKLYIHDPTNSSGQEIVEITGASGDITGVTAGTGLSGGGTSGGVTLNVDSSVFQDLGTINVTSTSDGSNTNPFDDAHVETRVQTNGIYDLSYTGASAFMSSAYSGGSASVFQQGAHYNGTDFYMRVRTDSSSWKPWRKLWHSGNDGAGSGLDADLLDGIGGTGYTRAGVESGTPNTASNRTTFQSNDAIETSSGNQSGLQVWQDTAGADAFMTFHVAGDYAGYFGLDGSTNDLSWGGWSNGANKYKIWHAGNDGTGSGLDADLLDGTHASSFGLLSGTQTFTGAKTFVGDLSMDNGNATMLALKGTRWGYSSSYKALQIGATSGTYAIALGYDPSGNDYNGFQGDGREILFRRGIQFVTPNAADDSMYLYNLVMLDGKVGIGQVTPGYTLDVTGNARFTSDLRSEGRLMGQNGGASAPAYSFTSQGNAGMYRYGDGVAFAAGGAHTFSTDSTKMFINQNVGIGTTAPADHLHVYGTSGTTQLRIETTADAGAQIRYKNDAQSWINGINLNNQYAWYSSELSATVGMFHVDGYFYSNYGIRLSTNNTPLQGRDTGGALRNLIKIDSSNRVLIGDASATGVHHHYPSTYTQINTDHGYLQIGPQNGSHCHFMSDIGNFYTTSFWYVNNGVTLSSYNQDVEIRRNNSSADRINISADYSRIIVNNTERFRATTTGATVTGVLQVVGGGEIRTDYGVRFNNGATDFMFYNNTNDNVFYLRDLTNAQMLQTWTPTETTIHKNLNVTGNLTVTGNISGTATSANNLRDSSNNLVRIDGSNELNFYNSAGNAAALYINHHNSNSEVNIANSGAQIGQTYGVRVPDGSVSTPTHSFNGDTNTGMYRLGDDDLGFTAGGSLKYGILNGLNRFYSNVVVGPNNNNSKPYIQYKDGYDAANAPSYSWYYDNGCGIGHPAGSTIAFSTGSSERGRFTNSGLQVINGSEAAPSYSFTSDTDTGIYRRTTNQIGFSCANHDQFYVADGSIHIEQPVRIQFANDQRIYDNGAGGLNIGAQAHELRLYSGGTDPIEFRFGGRSGTTRTKITSSGVLQWGATANQGNLTWDTGKAIVTSQSGSTLELRSVNTSDMIAIEDNQTRFIADGTERFRINGNGIDLSNNSATKICHNTNSTRDKYRVWNSSYYCIGMDATYTLGALDGYAMTFQMNDESGRGFWWGDHNHSDAQGAMSLDTNGKLLVAHSVRVGYGESDTTAPGASYKLDVSGNAHVSGNLWVSSKVHTWSSPTGHVASMENNGTYLMMRNPEANTCIFMGDSGDSNNYYDNGGHRFRSLGGGTYFGALNSTGLRIGTGGSFASYRLDVVGDAKISSGSLGVGVNPNATDGRGDFSNDVVAYSTSDKRLKENIKPLDNALGKVLKISGVEFDWKELTEEEKKTIHGNQGHDVGVIAQEVEEVLPEVVTTRDTGYKAVKYEKIVPLLIEAIKQQQVQIDELKTKLGD